MPSKKLAGPRPGYATLSEQRYLAWLCRRLYDGELKTLRWHLTYHEKGISKTERERRWNRYDRAVEQQMKRCAELEDIFRSNPFRPTIGLSNADYKVLVCGWKVFRLNPNANSYILHHDYRAFWKVLKDEYAADTRPQKKRLRAKKPRGARAPG